MKLFITLLITIMIPGAILLAQTDRMPRQNAMGYVRSPNSASSTAPPSSTDAARAAAITDTLIREKVVEPMLNEARLKKQTPDWDVIKKAAAEKYGYFESDKIITMYKLYDYYAKDAPAFCPLYIYYVEKFVDINDPSLLAREASILFTYDTHDFSKTWGTAQRWVSKAFNDNPADYDVRLLYFRIEDSIYHRTSPH